MTLYNGGKELAGSMWEPTNSESADELNLHYPFGRKILDSLIQSQNRGFKEFCLSVFMPDIFLK